MSVTLHKYIEIKEDGVWKPYSIKTENGKVNVFTDGLSLRDRLRMSNGTKLAHRGLPDDVTDEVKYDIWENGGFSITYATIEELNEDLDARFEEWKGNLNRLHMKEMKEEVGDKLDLIIKLLKKEEPDQEEKPDDDDCESCISYLIDEDLFDLIYERVEIEHLYRLAILDRFKLESDVRVIFSFG